MKSIRACGVIHLLSITVIGIMSFVAIACLAISIKKLTDNVNVLYILLIFGSVGMLSCGVYTLIIILRKKIILDHEKVFIPDDVNRSNYLVRKIQYETTIRYAEIQSIYLALRNTDTHNKTIANCVTPMINLVFVCKSGKEKVINLHSYSERQKINLIEYVSDKVAKNCGITLIETSGKEFFKAFERNVNVRHKK